MSGDVAGACEQLAGYLERLEELLPDSSRPDEGPAPGRGRHPASAPEPWNSPAGRALMDGHEGVRRLEASIRQVVAGGTGRRRGGSSLNTALALEAISRLAEALDEDDAARAVSFLDRWINEARQVDGIDEARRWRHLPRIGGERLPPRCPYCRCFQLLADVEARVVVCAVPGCRDRNGMPPAAVLESGPDGRPRIAWADGLTETAPDMPRSGL